MTVLVKHGNDDYRLHQDDGTQIGTSREDKPNQVVMGNILEEEYSGNSMLAKAAPRQMYTEIVTENVVYVDTTAGQVAPWNKPASDY